MFTPSLGHFVPRDRGAVSAIIKAGLFESSAGAREGAWAYQPFQPLFRDARKSRGPGIHTPGGGYGFRARSFHARPGMTGRERRKRSMRPFSHRSATCSRDTAQGKNTGYGRDGAGKRGRHHATDIATHIIEAFGRAAGAARGAGALRLFPEQSPNGKRGRDRRQRRRGDLPRQGRAGVECLRGLSEGAGHRPRAVAGAGRSRPPARVGRYADGALGPIHRREISLRRPRRGRACRRAA